MATRWKNERAEMLYEWYQKGYTLAQVGEMFGVTHVSVASMFKRRGWPCRIGGPLRTAPSTEFNGNIYALSDGYYKRGYGSRLDHKTAYLHRDIWEFHNGSIPDGYQIHHKDGNTTHNDLQNLEYLKIDDHTKEHHPLQEMDERYCEHCGKRLVRNAYRNGKLEHVWTANRRRFCNNHCARDAQFSIQRAAAD